MKIILCLLLLFIATEALPQQSPNLVYVDKQGVLRWTKGNQEAAFFGVNYTVPFAYGYRSHKAFNKDIEAAIDADVHHMWRLGLDGFRVHVWDVEISDTLGNLLNNEHLRLFDYLIKKLKDHNIKIFITPIAFWGNGYPEPDEKTPGFATKYYKLGSVVHEEAIKAQENYLEQFFKHVNPYTKLSYTDDPDIIAAEVNNEPHHSGPKEKTTEYVNRMVTAIKKAGWKKPIFYNISESPFYSDAIVKADVVGHSFQWYPSGLVANHEQKGNFLPHVDNYYIPFNDTVPGFKNRAKMVYEFDAADIMQPIMYPAMARSYRTAGFQWATQFAYDPMLTAYANTEYQTHYLNLAYTPAKAISLLIASKIFHQVPRGKSYGAFPADTVFDVFRISYREQIAEMNADTAFYYTGNTTTQPKSPAKLKHIAGVGSSQVVTYEGTGAYFLDKKFDGRWLLEVMPDAISIEDPFEKASPVKEVTRIFWREHYMRLSLPDLPGKFYILPLDGHNRPAQGRPSERLIDGSFFTIKPGKYLISVNGGDEADYALLHDFYAPPTGFDPVVVHAPLQEVTPGKTFSINVVIAGADTATKVSVELRNSSDKWQTVQMRQMSAYEFNAEVPADMVTPGIINYRIFVKRDIEEYMFPGAFRGNPYAWHEYRNESWQTVVAAPGSPVELFSAASDRNTIVPYTRVWRVNTIEFVTTPSRQLAAKATIGRPMKGMEMGWQSYFGDKIKGRNTELRSCTTLVIRARSEQQMTMKLALITIDANAYSVSIPLTKDWRDIEIPLNTLQEDSFLLLPRPYPGFLPLKFKSAFPKPLDISLAEKLEITFALGSAMQTVSIEVEGVWLK